MSISSLSFVVAHTLNRVLGGYIDLFAAVTRSVAKIVGVEAPRLPWEPAPPSIDQRLAKLEVAKAALMESLSAVEDLQRQAEESKAEHQLVRAQLDATIASKQDAERKLEAIQKLMAQDVGAFQALAGVPNIAKERLLGFASGVAASAIASGVVALIAWAWNRFVA